MRIGTGRLVLSAAAVAALAGCRAAGPLETETVEIRPGEAESVEVRLDMGAGWLRLRSGAEALLEGEVSFNVPRWRPDVDYRVVGGRGVLVVRQKGGVSMTPRGSRNEWDLRLGEALPLDLDVDLGAGEAELELGGLDLTSLEVSTGAGSVFLDLGGAWPRSFRARIQGGVGRTLIRLPAAVGVRLEASKGLGTISTRGLHRREDAWVNEAYGESEVTLEVEVSAGVGEIRAELA